jgi:hypothetical protein
MTARTVTLLILMPMTVLAQERPPHLVQLFHERLKPGVEAAYGRIEEDAARICAQLKCPNPYLALESVVGPKEVWWLNAYTSESHKDSVARAYEQNAAAMAALQGITERKKGLTYEPEEFFATYRSDLGDGSSWRMEGTRFFVMIVTGADRKADGCIFETPDGTRFIIATATTRRDANRKAAAAGSSAKVLAIRPSWSLPADAWIAADPGFWRASPAAKGR